MDLDRIIADAVLAERQRLEKIEADKKAAEEQARRRAEQLEAMFSGILVPALEEARRKLTANGIECSLTNGQDPQTMGRRQGLLLTWRGASHTLVFYATEDGDVRSDTRIAGGNVGAPRSPFTGTPMSADAAVAEFVERALRWMPAS